MSVVEVMMSSTVEWVTKPYTSVIFPLFLLNRCRLVGTCHGWLYSQKQQKYGVFQSSIFPHQANFTKFQQCVTARRSLVTNDWTARLPAPARACYKKCYNRKGSGIQRNEGNSSTHFRPRPQLNCVDTTKMKQWRSCMGGFKRKYNSTWRCFGCFVLYISMVFLLSFQVWRMHHLCMKSSDLPSKLLLCLHNLTTHPVFSFLNNLEYFRRNVQTKRPFSGFLALRYQSLCCVTSIVQK